MVVKKTKKFLLYKLLIVHKLKSHSTYISIFLIHDLNHDKIPHVRENINSDNVNPRHGKQHNDSNHVDVLHLNQHYAENFFFTTEFN